MIARPAIFAFVLLLTFPGLTATSPAEESHHSDLRFERDIQPIFREFCFDCHGATEELDGSLDLRLVRFLTRGGDSGPVIEPGDPDASYLLDRVRNGEMPPGEAHVPDEQVQILERWIAQGAKTLRPEPENLGPGIPITLEERSYWAFQPIERRSVPEFPAAERIRTPVDALLRSAMPEGLQFSPEASRSTLIKRVYFDLTGLPPTGEEFDRWMNLKDENWYEHLVDTVLESPHYGERWARHWLDVAGYADSEGNTVKDEERPWAWKYRDYIIRSLNADKPVDEFIIEQLAGDELAGPIQGDLTAEQIELLTATGFLRMAADGTGSGDNSAEARNKVVSDTIKIVSSSLLGMSVACAQCHDHRYDPISQIDYFAMRAVFEPALDWQKWQTPPQRRVSLYTAADREKAAEVEEEARKLAEERAARQKEYMEQALQKELEKYEEPLRGQLRAAYETPDKERTPEQTQLLDKNPSVKITPGVLYQYLPDAAEDLKNYDKKIAEIRAKKPKEEFIRVLRETPGHAPLARLFHRGDHQQPRQPVEPAALTIAVPDAGGVQFPVNDESIPTTGRRLAYAKWLTSPGNPLTPRVLVNRVWMHHFGTGLVSTPGDFGKLGDSPTHPELLDWLASEFTGSGWSLKKLHRLILTSTAWRQTSYPDSQMSQIDPENRFYWRKSLQRLEAEVLRDRMLTASGSLDRALFGPPAEIKEDETGQIIVDGPQKRRSLYIEVRRTQPVAMLQMFDAPVMDINCERRPVSTVATQSLMLMNGEFTLAQAELLAERVTTTARPVESAIANTLPVLPEPAQEPWGFGYGQFDETTGRTREFTPLPHWTGTEWQGSEKRPDPQIGWVFLTKTGGHPGNPKFGAIRRLRIPDHGVLSIAGKLSHASENGDGVRGRIVSSRTGLLGEWQIKHGNLTTSVDSASVQRGDTIDFITDCLKDENSDSFSWTVTATLKHDDGETVFDSERNFHGPVPSDSYDELPARILAAWELAYLRKPTAEERELAMTFVAHQLEELHRNRSGVADGKTPSQQVLINFCQTLLNSNEFLYVD
ncbi:PSD1 and planctomycete cytochrome C domain-containing protein [Rubinisphaera margarita]|uniref:PSD1 and planctomycete cytochrome C domain-containing protein n=1 Tax=Rubinisphaera margarita TaxID=2909586 RepID=UPI001EE92A57|nr:PSD1 and planctomycete cytochrome C domain-containing protein [Rubinisphaera margarita]MCG6156555.1 PSD1 and planctomycete cytochrome C domain-containing protein [Rubinisphaera margarita]